MYKFLYFLVMSITTFNVNAVEVSHDLNASQITTLRMHTSAHSNVGAKKLSLIKISGLNSNCPHGLFFDPVDNKETWSLVLSAYMAEKDVTVGYETTVKAPWGDPSYCQLTYFDIR